MLEQSEYATLWSVYLLAMVGILFVWWRMTSIIPWYIPKQVLRIVVAVLLIVPAPVSLGEPEWAPALFVWLFDVVLTQGDNAGRGLNYLLAGLAAALLVLLADLWLRKRKQQAQSWESKIFEAHPELNFDRRPEAEANARITQTVPLAPEVLSVTDKSPEETSATEPNRAEPTFSEPDFSEPNFTEPSLTEPTLPETGTPQVTKTLQSNVIADSEPEQSDSSKRPDS